jgi:hypothetical protein
MICVIGAKGNMGRRYISICNYLDIPCIGCDFDEIPPYSDKFTTHFIIATPTDTHEKILKSICELKKHSCKILCEKPINTTGYLSVLDDIKESGHEIFMVNQYAYYSHLIYESNGVTSYNYYNSGKDGIFFDCIQLIHLAKDEIKLSNNNPIWDASINGVKLDRETIDLCYVKMIKDFYSNGEVYGKLWGESDIKTAHEKVIEYGKNFNWHSRQVNIDPIAG